jgi:hypothetical protein
MATDTEPRRAPRLRQLTAYVLPLAAERALAALEGSTDV